MQRYYLEKKSKARLLEILKFTEKKIWKCVMNVMHENG